MRDTWGVPNGQDPDGPAFERLRGEKRSSARTKARKVMEQARVKSVEPHSGFMVAFRVRSDDELEVARTAGWDSDDGRTWEDPMHLTLSYCHEKSQRPVAEDVVKLVAQMFETFQLVTTGPGFFLPKEREDGTVGPCVHWAGAFSPQLEGFVSMLRAELSEAGIRHDETFPVYVPHITIAYREKWQESDIVRIFERASPRTHLFVPELIVCDGPDWVVIPMKSATETLRESVKRPRGVVAARSRQHNAIMGRSSSGDSAFDLLRRSQAKR